MASMIFLCFVVFLLWTISIVRAPRCSLLRHITFLSVKIMGGSKFNLHFSEFIQLGMVKEEST